MGYELIRFTEDVNEELVCTICSGVLEDPLQVTRCEHVFCSGCINEWIERQPTCPVDQQPITSTQLQPVPRIFRNLLSQLSTSCDHATFGCTAVLNLDVLPSHLADCEYGPKRPMQCKAGCGLNIPKDEIAAHNCVRELRALLEIQQARLTEFQQELADQRLAFSEQKRELNMYQQELADERLDYREHRQQLTMSQQELPDQRITINKHKKELTMPEEELADLCLIINKYKRELTMSQKELAALRLIINDHKRDLAIFKGQPKDIEIVKTEDDFGMCISRNTPGHFIITEINEHSFVRPHIWVGVRIVGINGTSVVEKKSYEVKRILSDIRKGTKFTMSVLHPTYTNYAPTLVGLYC